MLGHRGARLYAPENTLAAFDLALQHGADGFEFDVRCTGNRKPIICHDARVNRLLVRRSTFRELQAVSSAAARPPSLDQVLQRYASSAFLNIEVKVRGIEPLVVRALRKARPRRYFVSSFLPGVIRTLHQLDSTVVLGALAQSRWQLRRWRALPVSFVVPHYRLLSARLVRRLHASGKTVITWTVNDPRKMRRAARLGVDGIISDDTRLLRQTLGSVTPDS